MTHNNLLVFIVFLFSFLTNTLGVYNTDKVSQELIVSHDGAKMQDNRMYSLTKVPEGNISPEKLYRSGYHYPLPKKGSNRPDSNDVFCQSPCFPIQLWNVFSYVIPLHDQNSITYDMIVTLEMRRLAPKFKKIKITSLDEIFYLPIECDVKTQSNFNDGQSNSSTIEHANGQMKHYTFETLMHRAILTYNYRTKEVSNRDRKKLPCLLMEGGCETTAVDTFAYTWDTPENCAMTKILTDTKMLHYSSTTHQKEKQFFFRSEFNETGKGMNIKLKVFRESYELCGDPQSLYKTNFLNYGGAFPMPGGEIRTKEYSSNVYQFSIDNPSQVSYTSSSFTEAIGKWVGAQTWRSVGADEIMN